MVYLRLNSGKKVTELTHLWSLVCTFKTQSHKLTARLPLYTGCFSIAQARFFVCYTTTVGLHFSEV